jgi:hypothetical protein
MVQRGRTASRRRHPGHGRSGSTRAPREREPALLELQRLAGNRAVAGMLAPVQRSCCGGCASGGSCEQEGSDDQRARPAVAVQRYYTEDCDPYPVAQRRGGVNIAVAEATRAVDALQQYVNDKSGTPNATTARLLRENFTSSSQSTAMSALSRFARIKVYLDKDEYTIECENDCKDTKAYVYGVWTDVHMCMNKLTNESPRRYGEILLHEVSHDAGGTDDEEYYYPARTTTTLSRGDALDNADSYESFAAQI